MTQYYIYLDKVLSTIISNTEDDSATNCINILNRISYSYASKFGRSIQNSYNMDIEHNLMCCNCWGVAMDSISPQCGHLVCRSCLKIDNKTRCQICFYKYSSFDKDIKPNLYLNSIISVVSKKSENFNIKKTIANDFLRKKNYFEAISYYTKLLNEGFCRHIILSNRSYAYLMIDKLNLALEDSMELLKCAWCWYKAHYRHAMVLKRLNNHIGYTESLLNALTFKPDDNLLLSELEEAIEVILSTENRDGMKAKFDSTSFKYQTQEEILINIIHRSNERYLAKLSLDEVGGLKCRNGALFRSKSLNEINIDNLSYRKLPIQSRLEEIRSCLDISDFNCPLCMRICLNPVAIKCGHTFCKHCIHRTIDHTPTCPLCKIDIHVYFKTKLMPVCKPLHHILTMLWPIEMTHHSNHYEKELFIVTRSPNYSPFMICMVASPGMPCDLHLFEPRYRLMLRRAMESEVMAFGMVLHDPYNSNGHCEIGVLLEIKSVQFLTEGRYFVSSCASKKRLKIVESRLVDGYIMAKIESYVDYILDDNKIKEFDTLSLSVYASAEMWIHQQSPSTRVRIVKYFGEFPQYESYATIKDESVSEHCAGGQTSNKTQKRKRKSNVLSTESVIEPSHWVWWLCAVLPLDDKSKYIFLSCRDPLFRLEQMNKIINSLIM